MAAVIGDTRGLMLAIELYPGITRRTKPLIFLLAADYAAGGHGVPTSVISCLLDRLPTSVRRNLNRMAVPAGEPLSPGYDPNQRSVHPRLKAGRTKPVGTYVGLGVVRRIRGRDDGAAVWTVEPDWRSWWWHGPGGRRVRRDLEDLVAQLPPLGAPAVSVDAERAATRLARLCGSPVASDPHLQRLAAHLESRLRRGLEPVVLSVIVEYVATHEPWVSRLRDAHPNLDRAFDAMFPEALAAWRADHVRRSAL